MASTSGVDYDRSRRSLEIKLNPDDASKYRDVVIELDEGIAATDGAKLAPWKLTFMFGGQ